MNTSAKKCIIGIAGTLSSGKNTLANYLETNEKFLHISTSDMLRAEKKRVYGDSKEALLTRGDPFANKLRREKGAGILVKLANETFIKSTSTKLVVSGIRSIGEVEMLHSVGGVLLFVDADSKLRYERVTSRGRDSQDVQSYKDFMAQEMIETENIDQTDKAIQNQSAMRKMADYKLLNNGKLQAFINEAMMLISSL